MAELNELEQEDLDRQLLQIPGSVVDLPSVPKEEPRAAKGEVIIAIVVTSVTLIFSFLYNIITSGIGGELLWF